MAKIGLVTFSKSPDNYGQVLQALATQEYLKARGHRIYFLREHVCWHRRFVSRFKFQVKRMLFSLIGYERFKTINNDWLKTSLCEIMENTDEKRHPRHIEQFRKKYFDILYNSKKNLRKLNLDVLCTGSDQIWTCASKHYFLRFGSPQTKRIAIAPSTGNRELSADDKKIIATWLPSYSFITTREASGVKLCESLGYKDAIQILDPTFLLTANSYQQFASSQTTHRHYLFVYLLQAETCVTYDSIKLFANNNNLEIKYVTGGRRYEECEQIYATVQDWLALMRDAQYVITNSFHGMAFSVIFRKPFLVLPLTGTTSKTNERIDNIASEFGLTDRIFKGDFSILFKDIDYNIASKKVKENKKILENLMTEAGL